jgi:hypothetical protein
MPQPKVSIADGVTGDKASVTSEGLLKVDIGGASITTGDIDVNLTTADQVSVFGNEDGLTLGGGARALRTDSDGHLQVDVLSATLGTVTVDGSGVTQPVSITDIYSSAALTRSSPNLDGEVLLGTHALLSARVDASTTVGLTSYPSVNHNALHVAISDGVEIANVNSSNQLEVEVKNSPLKVGIESGTAIASYPQFDVDTSAFALSSASGINSPVTTAKEIIIQCDFANTGYIVVGDSGIVAAEGVDSMDGIRLEAGDTLTLAATTTANIYLRGSANDQLVNVMIIS